MPLHLLDHPLAAHLLTRLRDHETAPAAFREAGYRLGLLLALEATRALPTRPRPVRTPLETTTGGELDAPPVVVAVLRAGLSLLQPFLDLYPDAGTGFVGVERSHDDLATARRYYAKLPPLAGRAVFVVDPMLATGGSALAALDHAREAGGASLLALVTVVAAPEGVAAVHRVHPDLPIVSAALDRELDARKYIRPGLGDYGDRWAGT